MNKQISCENCKHYIKHYYWFKNKLVNAYCEHCTQRKRKRDVAYNSCCEKWDIAEDTSKQQNKALEKILIRTAKQIKEIAAILKCEN